MRSRHVPLAGSREGALSPLTHQPYRSWCDICVKCRGKESQSKKRRPSGIPLIQFDYAFVNTHLPGDEQIAVLAGFDLNTSYGMSTVVPKKGRHTDAQTAILQFLEEAGYAGVKVELQSDSESSVVQLMKDVAKARPDGMTLTRTTPPGHHQSNGGVERYIATFVGNAKCFREELKERMGREILAKSPWGSLPQR